MYSGGNERLLFGWQSAIGTAATEGYILPFNSNSISTTQSINQSGIKRGNKNPGQPYYDNPSTTGQIVVPVDSEAFWFWLKAAFNDPETTNLGDEQNPGPYQHEFKKRVDALTNVPEDMPYFTLERQLLGSTIIYHTYVGCKVGKISIGLGPSGEFTANIDVTACEEVVGENSTFTGSPASITESIFSRDQIDLVGADFTTEKTNDFSLDLDFKLDADKRIIGNGSLPSGVLGAIGEDIMGVSGSVKVIMKDGTLHEKSIEKTKIELDARITRSANDIISAQLRFHMLEALIERKTPSADGNGLVLFDPSFQAFYSNSANNANEAAVVATLINSTPHGFND